MNFLSNFTACLYARMPRWFQNRTMWLEVILVEACDKYTPTAHRWHDERMF